MSRLETANSQHTEAPKQQNLQLAKRLEELTSKADWMRNHFDTSRRNFDEYAEKTKEKRTPEITTRLESWKKDLEGYQAEIRNYEMQMAQVRQDMTATESRDKAVLDAERMRDVSASDAVFMERTLVTLLHSYPQLSPKMKDIEEKLQSMEQEVDEVQRALQSRNMVEAEAALLGDYKDLILSMVRDLQQLSSRGREATDAQYVETITGNITKAKNDIQVRYKNYYKLGEAGGNAGSQGGGQKLSLRDSMGKVGAVYENPGSGAASGIKNEISNMRVAITAGRITKQQEEKREVIDTKLAQYNPLKLDISLQHNKDLQDIVKKLAEKGSSGWASLGGLTGMFIRIGMERNTELENAMLAQMGKNANEFNPSIISIVAAVVNVANFLGMAGNLLSGGVIMGLQDTITAATSFWSLFIGDLKLGKMETLKALDMHDLDLYVQYTQKLKQLQDPNISSAEKGKIALEAQNISLLMQKRSLVTQRDLATVGNTWWAQAGRSMFGEKDPRAAIDRDLQELNVRDTGGVLPLHERYMELTRELSGKDLKDTALKGKVDELLGLEAQLKEKGVEMLSYMDHVKRATGTKINMPSEDSDRAYVAALRQNMTPEEMQKLFASMGDSEMLGQLAGDKEKTAKQAADFVTQAMTLLDGAGISLNINTAALNTGTADERLRAAKSAFTEIQTALNTRLANSPTYEKHIGNVERTMAQNTPHLWRAYEAVKNQPNLSTEEARNMLLPHVQEMYQQLIMHSEMLNLFTIGIVTGDPSKELAQGYITRFMNKSFQKEDMLNMTAELYGAANMHQGLGESAKELVALRTQRDALKDVQTLSTAVDDLTDFNKQLSGQVELYSTLQDSISSSPANPTEKGKLRSMLTESQTKLQTAYTSLQQFSGDQMASLLGDSSHRGVSEDFAEYTKATRKFLNSRSVEAMSKDMEATLQSMESASPSDQTRLVAAFEAKHIVPLRAEFTKLEAMAKSLTSSVKEYEQASGNAKTLEAYNKEHSHEGLGRAVDAGYTPEELKRPDIQKYLAARTAYRTQVQNLNRTMASFYGVAPANLDALLNKESHTLADLATLDRLMVVDESAFNDRGNAIASLVPTDPKEISTETARYTKMKDRADAYGRLLASVSNIASMPGNRDAALMNTLAGKGFIARPRRSTSQRNAYNDLGIIRPEDLKDAAIKYLDPQGKLSKQDLAGLMNTLVLLSGSRGHSTRPREGNQTFADVLQKSMREFLPRLRKNLPTYNQQVEGYTEATFINTFVEEQDMFQMLRTIQPVSGVPAGTKFINLGIHGSGSALVLKNNDRRFFSSQVVKNVGGVELAYTVYLKENCMNVQVSPQNLLAFVRNFRQTIDLKQPGLLPKTTLPDLDSPSITHEIAVKELRELYFTVNRNPVAISSAAVTLLGQIIKCYFKTPPTETPGKNEQKQPEPNEEPVGTPETTPGKNQQIQPEPNEEPIGTPEPKPTPKPVPKPTPKPELKPVVGKNQQVSSNTDIGDKTLSQSLNPSGNATPQEVYNDVMSHTTSTQPLPVKPATTAPAPKAADTDVEGVL